ncbi:MAG: CocE/NonD family hydrolase [Candidatus Latescibacterota bacterium]|nr:MAG: CocE/NonD family hydrolase [Candidatus Latescibacterota bacterium]
MKTILVLSLLFTVQTAVAQPQPGTTRFVEETVIVPMRDGVQLEATLVRPDDDDMHAAILVRTPYGRGQHLAEARLWAQNGYAVLVQDARGKFGSEGEYLPFTHEHDDGMDTLDWITNQQWNNGSIGMYGSSYLAFCQLILASSGHPALKSIMPISGWIQDDGPINASGANHIMLSIPWILHEESQTKRSLADYELDELFEYLPLIDVFESVGLDSKIWNEDFDFTHLEQYHAENIDIPALHMSGWFDFVCGSAMAIYDQARRGPAGSLQKLVVGPWAHDQFWTTYTEVGDEDFGPESAMGHERLAKLALEWFDATLGESSTIAEWPDATLGESSTIAEWPDATLGESSTIAEWPDARIFVMGANRWVDFDSWPPQHTRDHKLFIASERGANSLDGDGTLSTHPPRQQGFDTYIFDPMNPVPTYGGANMHFFLHLVGVKNQRDIESRDDVLVYTTPPLENQMEIAGPIKAVYYVSTEGKDTDFTAKLVEVRADGYARIIEEGIIRASFRNGRNERQLLEPGEIYRVTIELGSTAIQIPAGHRIRLEISSSNFPKYDRNPNNGDDPIEARTLHAVTQRVYFGGDNASYVSLPVVVPDDHVTHRR